MNKPTFHLIGLKLIIDQLVIVALGSNFRRPRNQLLPKCVIM